MSGQISSSKKQQNSITYIEPDPRGGTQKNNLKQAINKSEGNRKILAEDDRTKTGEKYFYQEGKLGTVFEKRTTDRTFDRLFGY